MRGWVGVWVCGWMCECVCPRARALSTLIECLCILPQGLSCKRNAVLCLNLYAWIIKYQQSVQLRGGGKGKGFIFDWHNQLEFCVRLL